MPKTTYSDECGGNFAEQPCYSNESRVSNFFYLTLM